MSGVGGGGRARRHDRGQRGMGEKATEGGNKGTRCRHVTDVIDDRAREARRRN